MKIALTASIVDKEVLQEVCTVQSELNVGLDKLCLFFLPIIFLLTILKKSAYYSSLLYPLFQLKDVTLILKRHGCYYSITESEI